MTRDNGDVFQLLVAVRAGSITLYITPYIGQIIEAAHGLDKDIVSSLKTVQI